LFSAKAVWAMTGFYTELVGFVFDTGSTGNYVKFFCPSSEVDLELLSSDVVFDSV
jgi:hypothetical protein